MKLNKLIVASLMALGSFTAANAAVTITFNAAFSGGLSSNLANTAGVVSNGLKWGIIVDTTGNSFLSQYDAVAFTQGTNTTLTVGNVATDDRLILATSLTSDSGQGGQALEGDFTTPGGNGGVDGLIFALANGVAAGQKYFVVWIDESTKKAGALGNAAFVIPADGQTVSHDSPFLGVDPVRGATNIQFAVPEPSSMLLGLLGALGFIRRRR
ncbi:PEP-CTERM sorting domain-containing protein [Haloferula sp. BvORR071]|uniref:PEP-CTERM sorting domain-containing protein n=1 Tax=Haloferula sp. BvORR071 TaxID=1396141 RepID=UPI000557A27F|nr:PEP-CTERM sorting domain-containing protein [Haloferula sp. BvORR071]